MRAPATRVLLPVICLAIGTAACGGQPTASEAAPQQEVLEIEVPESVVGDAGQFNASFEKAFRESCVTGAIESGVSQDVAQAACDCGVETLNEKFSAIDKARLTTDQLDVVLRQCAEKVMNSHG